MTRTSTADRSRRRTLHPRRLLAMVLVLLLLLAACSAGDDGDAEASDDTAEAGDATAAAEFGDDEAFDEEAMEEAEADEALGLAESDPDGRDVAQAEPAAPEAAEDGSAAPPPTTASTGERIIKEGTVTVQIEPGEFDTAFGQIVARAQALGGHVSWTSSSTNPGPDDTTLTSGQVTIRIPVQSFEDLLTSLGDAGEVVDRNITSQDVTAEFTDLESRRRNLQAQERFYLGLLDQAQGVEDAIAIQQQLDGIQSQIEQITGRLNLLEDRSSFSTLTVLLQERGATTPEPVDEEPGGLAPYIDQAIETLIATVGGLIVVATFLSPFLVILGVAYLIWRTVFRGRRTIVPPSQVTGPQAPPAASEPREPVDA
ncbi:DUF4349 domain-containing protein [Euzebya tangerina]|uniref:DUF4349 domain-containing protein n=1 Tax=Euzebya tangerina TaxID=591198 RepID=UPI002F32D4DE